MMHKKNLVVAIKVNGKVLRESNDRVELPFGSEYSMLLKNLDTVRQQVQIQIDGGETSGWLVLNPGENQSVERFVRGNLEKGKRFKFIERTEAVEKHRGIEAEDGLIRIEFKREKVVPPVMTWPLYTYTTGPIRNGMRSSVGAASVIDAWKYSSFDPSRGACGQSVNSGGANFNDASSGVVTMDWADASTIGASANNVSTLLNAQAVCFDKDSEPTLALDALAYGLTPKNDVGITVDGSVSDQRFITVSDFETEEPEVLVLHLIGRKGEAPVKVAKTVSIKLACQTCGKKNRSLLKFCPECGTNLETV